MQLCEPGLDFDLLKTTARVTRMYNVTQHNARPMGGLANTWQPHITAARARRAYCNRGTTCTTRDNAQHEHARIKTGPGATGPQHGRLELLHTPLSHMHLAAGDIMHVSMRYALHGRMTTWMRV